MTIEHGLALIMVVGEGMRYAVGVAATACAALADAGVNIEMINQGSSEISIMFGVKEVDRKAAVQALARALLTQPSEPGVLRPTKTSSIRQKNGCRGLRQTNLAESPGSFL